MLRFVSVPLCQGSSCFVLCRVITHLRVAAKYETQRKDSKEDVAFITLARCQVTFEKEMKNLKP
jgi:hypothetical protein